MSTSSPEDDLLIDLHSIATIKADCKLSVSDEYISLQPPTPGLWMMRYLRGDNRRRTIEKVKKIVDYCLEFSQTHIEIMSMAHLLITPSSKMVEGDVTNRCRERFLRLEILTTAMQEALGGLQQLELTYTQTISSQINVCVRMSSKKLQALKRDALLLGLSPQGKESELQERIDDYRRAQLYLSQEGAIQRNKKNSSSTSSSPSSSSPRRNTSPYARGIFERSGRSRRRSSPHPASPLTSDTLTDDIMNLSIQTSPQRQRGPKQQLVEIKAMLKVLWQRVLTLEKSL